MPSQSYPGSLSSQLPICLHNFAPPHHVIPPTPNTTAQSVDEVLQGLNTLDAAIHHESMLSREHNPRDKLPPPLLGLNTLASFGAHRGPEDLATLLTYRDRHGLTGNPATLLGHPHHSQGEASAGARPSPPTYTPGRTNPYSIPALKTLTPPATHRSHNQRGPGQWPTKPMPDSRHTAVLQDQGEQRHKEP